MGFLFPCPKCHATYDVVRINQPPRQPPKCVRCEEDLPWGDSADWFDYRQIKPELPDAAAWQALEWEAANWWGGWPPEVKPFYKSDVFTDKLGRERR